MSQSIRPVHVGVGTATLIDEIQVFWPSGLVES
ncbi:MAG: ASPIC/UnbV domain-containing protein [Bacteroidetes bacterium]|nr:ASPIC/UnbV domain-containing protein [Bacteroidota bacterium]